jgi:hypothetical protein
MSNSPHLTPTIVTTNGIKYIEIELAGRKKRLIIVAKRARCVVTVVMLKQEDESRVLYPVNGA